ncbi:hypothetical protein SEPCBS119000_001373 [Sporothrix epigloea]|uniref:DUF7598 domain-containing protein n=1 Tax=Sporothrix epigloea TaxID=1892477 RepID=A0ABP0DDC2_9PEZI
MFNLPENTRLRGLGYKALNALRLCNIIVLLAVVAASWVMVVLSGVTGQFFFFDAITHVFASSAGIFLILTEIQRAFLKRYLERAWPVFSKRHGFLWLGIAMIVLGCDLLGNLNKPVFSSKNLGLPLWRLIMASGILSLTFGCLNCIATAIFRDGPSGLTARMIRADGNLANASNDNPSDYYTPSAASILGQSKTSYDKEYGSSAGSVNETATEANLPAAAARRLKRITQVFRKRPLAAEEHGGLVGKKIHICNALPISRYDEEAPEITGHGANAASGDYSCYTNSAGAVAEHLGVDEDRRSEQGTERHSTYVEDHPIPLLPHVRRPPVALHPAMSSKYSVANMSRF